MIHNKINLVNFSVRFLNKVVVIEEKANGKRPRGNQRRQIEREGPVLGFLIVGINTF